MEETRKTEGFDVTPSGKIKQPKVSVYGRNTKPTEKKHIRDGESIPFEYLPETVMFSGRTATQGERLIINVPAGFKDLCYSEEEGCETVIVSLYFPYRSIYNLKKEINSIKQEYEV